MMKRFFLVFSILMIVFLVLMTGLLAVVKYCSIEANNLRPAFFQGWGLTLIPYHGNEVVYADGDVFLIKRIPPKDIRAGDVVLFYTGDKAGIISGYVSSVAEGSLGINSTGRSKTNVPAADIVGTYKNRIPVLANVLNTLKTPISIGVFAAVLLASIVLWRILPSRKPEFDGLSMSDSEISSIYY